MPTDIGTTVAYLAVIPQCQFHPPTEKAQGHNALFDFKTKQGPWAYGCRSAWEEHRAYPNLGTGKGQRLILEMTE